MIIIELDRHHNWIIIELNHHHHWIIIIITVASISSKWYYLSSLLVIGSSTEPTLFHVGCRPSLHVVLHHHYEQAIK